MPNSNPSRNAKYLHNAPFYQAFSRKTLPLDSTKTLIVEVFTRFDSTDAMTKHRPRSSSPAKASLAPPAGIPSRWNGSALKISRHAPRLGEHSLSVFRDAGISANEIDALLAGGTTIDGEVRTEADTSVG